MNTLPILIGALCVYALAYRFYSAFIAAKALALDDRRTTPAHQFADHHNYVASPKWVLFGHHFAAIAGAGPLVGPTLAAQFGFAPGFLWLLIGAVIAGCVQDFTILVALYGFIASVLPVWLLLEPRDYLSTYVKLGTIVILVIGVFMVHPNIQFPNFTQFISGGGPIIKGKLFPFLFVTIACGAISGFHALVSSGTTPKMLDKETDARFIGYGAMISESLVGVLALIAACSMHPGDYFAINTPPEVFSKLGMSTVNLDTFSREVGEKLAGRTGGAVSLAVGMAQIFKGLPGMDRLMGYWYHYAIMFEALFILTTIDTGTRVARYVLQELMGKVNKPFSNSAWMPGNLVTTFLVVLAWGYLIYTGSISTLWPLFGTGNQLLATIALAVTTSFLINMEKARYAWITAVPMVFVGITTVTAGVESIENIFWPLTKVPGKVFTGYLDSILMAIFIAGVVLVMIDALRRWYQVLRGAPVPREAFGTPVTASGEIRMGCC